MVHHERLADRLQRFGVEPPVIVAAPDGRVPVLHAHRKDDYAVKACDAVTGLGPFRQPFLLQQRQRLRVVHLDCRAPFAVLLRRLLPNSRVYAPIPVADVATVSGNLRALQEPSLPVRLDDLVVEREVEGVGRHAHSLRVSAAPPVDDLLHGVRRRKERPPARHLPVSCIRQRRRNGDRKHHCNNFFHGTNYTKTPA